MLGGAVPQNLGHTLGDRLDAIHEGRRGVGDRGHHLRCCILRQLLVCGQTLCKALADVQTDLVKDLGGRVDAEDSLDGIDHALHLGLDTGHKAIPCTDDTVLDTQDDVGADVAPFSVAAVPDAHDLGNAGNGGLSKICDAEQDAIHQSGQQGGTALEQIRQVRNQCCCKFCQQLCGRSNQGR